jgi:hypothetical protein
MRVSRGALLAAAIASTPVPRLLAITDLSSQECKNTLLFDREACESRVAATPKVSFSVDGVETSPLIEELKRRSANNKEANQLAINSITSSANSGVYASDMQLRLVRFDGVAKMVGPNDIKVLQSRGYEVVCPSTAALPCEVKQGQSSTPVDPNLCGQANAASLRAVCE